MFNIENVSNIQYDAVDYIAVNCITNIDINDKTNDRSNPRYPVERPR